MILLFREHTSKQVLHCHVCYTVYTLRMRTGLDFKYPQFDQVCGKDEDWIKMRGLEK